MFEWHERSTNHRCFSCMVICKIVTYLTAKWSDVVLNELYSILTDIIKSSYCWALLCCITLYIFMILKWQFKIHWYQSRVLSQIAKFMAPDRPHVGPMNLAIRGDSSYCWQTVCSSFHLVVILDVPSLQLSYTFRVSRVPVDRIRQVKRLAVLTKSIAI